MALQVDGYSRALAVTKSDTTVVDCKGFYVGVTGDVAVQTRGRTGIADGSPDTAVTLKGCVAGQVYRIEAYRIMSTGTTATDLVALY